MTVQAIVYPKYETRGDLGECVSRFSDWYATLHSDSHASTTPLKQPYHRLLNKVIDLEVAAGTPSPTIDPLVRVILVGHSMGGIVAAETAIALAAEQPIHNSSVVDDDKDSRSETKSSSGPLNALMFPYIQGVLAFDTPFLGISPGVVAHSAESHYAAASTAIAQVSALTSLWGGAKAKAGNTTGSRQQQPAGALPPAGGKEEDNKGSAAGGKSAGWGRWGAIAMAAGAVGAVAAGGAAAYYNREQLSQGWGWATSHLEFVGCLARKEELRRRVAYMVRLSKELGVGFGNLYTRLGQAAGAKQVSTVGTVLGSERTFCVVPKRDQAGDWYVHSERLSGAPTTVEDS